MMVEIIKSYYDTTKNMELVPLGTKMDVPNERAQKLIDAKVAKEIVGKKEENPIKSKKK